MISKFEDVDPKAQKYGSRAAIVFSGSPLFTGGAGGGESEIRKWIIEQDMLEAIVALPEQMFYNTGIGTYIWIVTNRKAEERKGKIQLVDARDTWMPMRRSHGDKRRKIGEGKALEGDDRTDEPDQIADIVRLYGRFEANEKSKLFDNADFGYTRVTVERPLKLPTHHARQVRLPMHADLFKNRAKLIAHRMPRKREHSRSIVEFAAACQIAGEFFFGLRQPKKPHQLPHPRRVCSFEKIAD
jgi:hypothetical protein